MLDGKTLTNTFIKIPLKTMNRHSPIAGADAVHGVFGMLNKILV
jgi:hypothetical protein